MAIPKNEEEFFSVVECPNITAKTENEEISGTAKIYMTKTSRLKADLYLNKHPGCVDSIKSICGVTDNNVQIMIDNPLATNVFFPCFPIEISMSRLRFENDVDLQPNQINCYLKNCKTYFSGIIEFDAEEFHLASFQSEKPPIIGRIGSELSINILHKQITEIETIIDAICSLLSIFQRVLVDVAYIEKRHDGKLVSAEAYNLVNDNEVVIPMLPRNADILCEHITNPLAEFLNLESTYNLHMLKHYYCKAYTEIFDEYKFIFGSIFMEALKFYWAKNVSNLRTVTNPNTGLIKGYKEQSSNNFLSFEDLMNRMAQDIGIASGSFSFIENRNMLFHSGLASATHLGHNNAADLLWDELLKLYDQMDEALLKILGFSGRIFTMRNPNSGRQITK